MGKKTVEKEEKKKKKGRPSLLDLQKRSIRLQQQQHQHQKRNPIPNFRNPNPNYRNPSPNPVRRSTRRNPNQDGDQNEDEEDEESNGKRREKKLKLVLRLPPRSSSANSRGGGSDEGSYGSEDSNGGTPRKKRKINAVAAGDGSTAGDGGFRAGSAMEKAEKHNSGSKATEPLPGMPLNSDRGTPLPDKKLLVFILDRLQKKDTYSVFSDPVDPNELPDYHEVIEHPMDFSTVRKKLASGTYSFLEQFEKDVVLISSNAMRYNAPDTIYFRQARSIQELAKKDFENLRQDSEDNEPEMKTARRGRPPGKSSIKRLGRPPFERAGSEFSSDATLATAGDNSIWSNSTHDFSRKAQLLDKPSSADVLARTSFRNGENYGWLAEHKSDRHDENPGSIFKGMSKFGKKPFVFDENRRSTCKLSQQSVSGREPSVLTTFDGEKKQLMAVGVHMELAYARSLARFAGSLGPIAWKVASKKIAKALPTGMKFGPGWVGENEAPQTQLPLLSASPPRQPHPPMQNPSQPKISSYTMPRPLESKIEKLVEKQEPLNDSSSEAHLSRALPASASTSAVTSRSSGPTEVDETVRGINYGSGFSLVNSGVGFRPKPPFQLSQNPIIHTSVNGFASGYGLNVSSQVGKPVGVGPARPAGNFGSEVSTPSRLINMVPRSNNNFVNPMPTNRSEAEDAKLLGSSSSINPMPDSGPEGQTGSAAGLRSQHSWRGKSDSVPPDLNVRFQSPGSPTSGVSQPPDLALQL